MGSGFVHPKLYAVAIMLHLFAIAGSDTPVRTLRSGTTTCADSSPDPQSELLIYAQNTNDSLVLTVADLQRNRKSQITFELHLKGTRFLAYLPENLVGAYVVKRDYFMFDAKLRHHPDKRIHFDRKADLKTFPFGREHGDYISALASDQIGLRVFVAGGRARPSVVTNILYYTPESQQLTQLFRIQQPIFDMAYYPVRKRLFLIADHLLFMDLTYVKGRLEVAPSSSGWMEPLCNPFFGIFQFSADLDCVNDYPVLYFMEKRNATRRWYLWRTVDGETGNCTDVEQDTTSVVTGRVKKFLLLHHGFFILYSNGSLYGPRREHKLSKHSHNGILHLRGENITALTSVIPDQFTSITSACLARPGQTSIDYASYISSTKRVLNSTSIEVSTYYDSERFSGICSNISFPSLKLRILYNSCPKDLCPAVSSSLADTLTAPGVQVITNLLPEVPYNITVATRGYYISQAGLYTSRKRVQLFVPRQRKKTNVGLVVGLAVPALVILLAGCILALMWRRRRKAKFGNLYASNNLYLGVGCVPEYTKHQVQICNPDVSVGHGRFGQVYEAALSDSTDKTSTDSTKTKVAVKQVEDIGLLIREAKIMEPLQHQNLVRLIGVCRDVLTQPCLLLEWMDDGDLLGLLKTGPPLSVQKQNNILIQVCRGFQYLSSHGCVHRDIAARNVLCSKSGSYKLADFGLSREVQEDKDYYRMVTCGALPVKWMAPECVSVTPAPIFSTKSDVWSFGVLMFEVYTAGGDPYPSKTADEAVKFIQSGGCPTLPTGCGEDKEAMVNQCWMPKPCDRISSDKLLQLLQIVEDNYLTPKTAEPYSTLDFSVPANQPVVT